MMRSCNPGPSGRRNMRNGSPASAASGISARRAIRWSRGSATTIVSCTSRSTPSHSAASYGRLCITPTSIRPSRNPSICCKELSSNSSSPTSGSSVRMTPNTSGRTPLYVAASTKPTRRLPTSPRAARCAVVRARSACASVRRASTRNAHPACVSVMRPFTRANSSAPSSCSRSRICRLSGGCAMCSRAAACPKCNSSATATNYRRWRSSMRSDLPGIGPHGRCIGRRARTALVLVLSLSPP